MNEPRQDPDQLLARVERDEAKAKRGRLKIFFGAAAGVGKSYAMLLAARERRAENLDVIVGLLETHGRADTEALLAGLEILPTRKIDYKGAVLQEFDIDAALKRRPAIILVDELAHTNAPGSRHPKRWQDIRELLEAGIDVYTALNVQHLESLNDDVGQIAGVRIWETVPDTVFECADEVELVDLPPDELLLRLKEGKVYLPQQAEHAIQHFFRKGNLIALRELALRQTTNRVDAQMLDYREDNAIREVWQVNERLMVCIGPNVLAERLVRAGKRLATSLRTAWIAVYVETPELARLPAEKRDGILRVLRLAEQLGAETVTLSAPEMSEALIRFARERNINKIVVGKPSRRGWRRWLLGSVVDVLISHAHNINIYLLGSPHMGEREELEAELSLFKKSPLPGLRQRIPSKTRRRYRGYLWAMATTLLCTAVGKMLFGKVELANVVMVYLLGVVFIATRFGRGPSVLASLLSVGVFDVLFVRPFYSLSVADGEYLITLLAMLVVAIVISNLMVNVRAQAKVAAHRERRAAALYAMSKELAVAQSEVQVVAIAVKHLYAEFSSRNVILFANPAGRLIYPKQRSLAQSLRSADLSVAQWVYDHNEMAGQGTHTLPGSAAIYFPIQDDDKAIGVLALLPVNLRRVFLPEQQKLLETFLRQIGQAVARLRFSEQAKLSQMQIEAERLRNSLLSAISHDLRTPLATIIGSASALVEDEGHLQTQHRLELSRAIYDEAERMANLVNNILDMARLDAGVVELNKQWHPVEEIIGTVLTRLQKHLSGRKVSVTLPPGIPLVFVDAVMIEQVLINLLENALRYTATNTELEVLAKNVGKTMEISVADHGPGIPKGLEDRLFEKFYQARHESAQSGVGLGLAICRAIVEVHGGRIRAKNRVGGGAIFTFTLPTDELPPSMEPEE
ncbi:sensor histidine kinase [Methylomonas albis]|uniref:histidine kinase n=1 Tax=Methylomonas albis TaxID=1854563 RepID=A0ABR9D2I4_9GAMM|nr:sensor histidine kinase KdpD [Methylomonas albis]MBD9357041.1 sensor histidine kinase KdpD [Methylomonas albis]